MNLEEYIKLEQIKAVYKNRYLVILGALGVILATTWMFWSSFSHALLTTWAVLGVVALLVRWLTTRKYQPEAIHSGNYKFCTKFTLFWSLVTGSHWSLIPAFLLGSATATQTLFITIIYTGQMSSAMSTNSSYSPSYYAFGLCPAVMFAGRFFYEGGTFYTASAIMIIFHFVITCFLSSNAQKIFKEAREFNFKNMQLMDELVVQKDTAEQATLSKDRFLAAASHDLRQPLHSSGLLLSALEQYVVDDEGKELLNDLHSSAEALNHSFNSLLDLSRLDAGVVIAERQNISIHDLLDPLLKKYRLSCEEKGLSFRMIGQQQFVNTDPILLERVMQNLVSNAIAYTRSGEVRISWEPVAENYIRLLVEDTGIGVASDDVEEIFSEYYQINNPERDRAKGFGLGLAIVKRLCSILDINIYVSSQLNQGTSFALYVQAGDQSKTVLKEQTVWPLVDLAGTLVLVIDDDESVLKSMTKLLRAWGCEVIGADSEGQAIELIVELDVRPDIVVADYRLREEKTGVQAVNRICDELNSDIPSIIVTGDTSPTQLQVITSSGLPVLHKPVSVAVLRAAIQRQLGTRKEMS